MAEQDAYAFFQQDVQQERSLLLDVLKRKAQQDAMMRSISPEQTASATSIAQTYPTAPAAVVAPLGMAMADPTSEAVREVVRRVDEDNGGFTDWLGRTAGAAFQWGANVLEKIVADPLEDIARVTMLGWDTFQQELISRPYRT